MNKEISLIDETITLIVKVKINYPEKKRREEAIEEAKKCTLSKSVIGLVGCKSISSKLRIAEKNTERDKNRLLSKYEKIKGYSSSLFDGEEWREFDAFCLGYSLANKENI